MMKTHWDNLNEREQKMLVLGGGCLVVFLIYILLYAPLLGSVRDKTKQLAEKKDTLTWMQQAHQQRQSIKTPQTLSNSKLLSVLAEQLKSTSFRTFPYQLQQTGSGDIQLSFEQVPYNAFVAWLWSLKQTYAFSVKQFNAQRTDRSGVVKVAVTFVAITP